MSSLDDKLHEILESLSSAETGNSEDDEWKIAQIKAAFESAGYVKEENKWVEYAKQMEQYMTGQEFYDRFIHELKAFYTELDIPQQEAALTAAKRAAGIDTETST